MRRVSGGCHTDRGHRTRHAVGMRRVEAIQRQPRRTALNGRIKEKANAPDAPETTILSLNTQAPTWNGCHNRVRHDAVAAVTRPHPQNWHPGQSPPLRRR